MKTISRAVTMAVAAGVFAILFATQAAAGCGDTSNLKGPFQFAQEPATDPSAGAASGTKAAPQYFGGGPTNPSIVGMWSVQFVSVGNVNHSPSIPDGAIVDFGYSQWHSDGTEMLNSGAHAPATQNYCLGVWGQTGFNAYELNHFALSYDPGTGLLAANVIIREQVILSPSGDLYSGTFTIDVYDPKGNHVDHIGGNINAQRVTVDTTTPVSST